MNTYAQKLAESWLAGARLERGDRDRLIGAVGSVHFEVVCELEEDLAHEEHARLALTRFKFLDECSIEACNDFKIREQAVDFRRSDDGVLLQWLNKYLKPDPSSRSTTTHEYRVPSESKCVRVCVCICWTYGNNNFQVIDILLLGGDDFLDDVTAVCFLLLAIGARAHSEGRVDRHTKEVLVGH